MREKIKFDPNVTQFVKLDGAPTPTQGITGPQWQYFLQDEKIMWIDPPVHDQIQALGVREIAITRNTTTRGGKRVTTWTVEPVGEEPIPIPDEDDRAYEPPPPPRFTPPPPPARKQPQPAAAPTRPAPAPQPAPQTADSDAQALLSALMSAITATQLAQSHAAELGIAIQFDSADIRSLASGLMIERRDRAARRAA